MSKLHLSWHPRTVRDRSCLCEGECVFICLCLCECVCMCQCQCDCVWICPCLCECVCTSPQSVTWTCLCLCECVCICECAWVVRACVRACTHVLCSWYAVNNKRIHLSITITLIIPFITLVFDFNIIDTHALARNFR